MFDEIFGPDKRVEVKAEFEDEYEFEDEEVLQKVKSYKKAKPIYKNPAPTWKEPPEPGAPVKPWTGTKSKKAWRT
jgi:hypothetical protein